MKTHMGQRATAITPINQLATSRLSLARGFTIGTLLVLLPLYRHRLLGPRNQR